jgi:DNA-binding MarR family transcriptional regulator
MNRQVLLNLKKAVSFAEAGLELRHLTLLEKEMYYSVLEIVDQNNEFSSDLLKDTVKVLDIPHATYHRLIKNLLEKGFIEKAANRQRNAYLLVKTV